jgi:hypothetical protein
LLKRLEDETYLEQNGFTIEGIVDTEVIKFENKTKRSLDVNDRNMPTEKIVVQGLRANDRKGFGTNRIFVTRWVSHSIFGGVGVDLCRNDFLKIFMPHLTEIWKLMKDQLSAANDAGHRVQVCHHVTSTDDDTNFNAIQESCFDWRLFGIDIAAELSQNAAKDPR